MRFKKNQRHIIIISYLVGSNVSNGQCVFNEKIDSRDHKILFLMIEIKPNENDEKRWIKNHNKSK